MKTGKRSSFLLESVKTNDGKVGQALQSDSVHRTLIECTWGHGHCTKSDNFFSKCDQIIANLVTFTKEILNGKLHFLCSGRYDFYLF